MSLSGTTRLNLEAGNDCAAESTLFSGQREKLVVFSNEIAANLDTRGSNVVNIQQRLGGRYW